MTFQSVCNYSTFPIFRSHFKLSNLKKCQKYISGNTSNYTRTVDPCCPGLKYLLTHIKTHFLLCDSISEIHLLIITTYKSLSPLNKALVVLSTLPYILFSQFTKS